jgi:VIT1/CCC1 family predicted Fe2+/Mn2+ transporter
MNKDAKEIVLEFQKNEITEHFIYLHLANQAKGKNREVLSKIGNDELKHYNEWKEYTGEDVKKNDIKVFAYILLSKIFGITFAVKLMENGEKTAEKTYKKVEEVFPKATDILKDEIMHEKLLVKMIEEEKLGYISSIVLGLNDALVEITGTLAGLTFALQNSTTTGVAGLITGSAASLSMAASEYLSQKADNGIKNPLKASFYTFAAYLTVVFMLVIPFFFFKNYKVAFLISLLFGALVIILFSFFVSVVQERQFRKIFVEMFVITASVAIISFLIGIAARKIFHIEV